MTPDELSREVRDTFAYAVRYLGLLVQNNPHGSPGQLLSRPDVEAVLAEAMQQARDTAAEAVRRQWAASGGPEHEYLTWLLADVDRAYRLLGQLRFAIRHAHLAVPEKRASAVRTAMRQVIAQAALRTRLTLEVAGTAARTLKEIADGEQQELAGATAWKQWLCSRQPPDARTCHWCRLLNGLIVPLHADFPGGDPADLTGHGRLTRPPRLYRGRLHGPPRHPGCRCHIEILTGLPGSPVVSGPGGQESAANAAPHTAGSSEEPGGLGLSGSFLTAASIRDLPEDRYQALIHFLQAATHELGQQLARLRKALGP